MIDNEEIAWEGSVLRQTGIIRRSWYNIDEDAFKRAIWLWGTSLATWCGAGGGNFTTFTVIIGGGDDEVVIPDVME